MKKLFTIITLALATASAFAQQDTTIVETRSYNNLLSKTIVTNPEGQQSSTLNVNIPGVPNYGNWGNEEHYSALYFGFAFAGDKNLPINSTKSWEWGMYPLSGTLLHSRNYRTLLTWGLGFSRTSFKLKDQAPKDDLQGFVSQRFRYWSWRLPISLEFRSDDYRSFVTLGIEAEMRHHVRARKYDKQIAHATPEQIVGLDKNIVNPWGCNLLFQAGHHGWGIVGRLSLTDLFDPEETHLKASPFSIGLSIGF